MAHLLNMIEMTEETYHKNLRGACDTAVTIAAGRMLKTLEDHGDGALKAMLEGYAKGELALGPDFYPWTKKAEEKKDGT